MTALVLLALLLSFALQANAAHAAPILDNLESSRYSRREGVAGKFQKTQIIQSYLD